MRKNIKKWLRPVLFTAGGALAGFAYYCFVGCASGACPLTSHAFHKIPPFNALSWADLGSPRGRGKETRRN